MRLANESVMFRSMFAAAPTCSPSRAALLTGEYPHTCGQLGTAHRGFPMDHYDRHFARVLQSHGYATALAGIQHEAPGSLPLGQIGYEERIGDEREPEVAAAQWLGAPRNRPFFLSCGFLETHREFPELDAAQTAAARDGLGAPVPAGLPDTPAVREDFARFRASLVRLDARIGVVLDALEASGQADSTIVLSTTDHGIAFPGMKCTLKDAGLGVMCLLRVPGVKPMQIDALTSHLDLVPTLCELLDVAKPAWLVGHSLLPLIDGSAASVRDHVFAEINFHAAPEPTRAVRSARYKYIRRYAATDLPILANVDDSPTKTEYLDAGWHTIPIGREQLYDLLLDPTESCNLIDDRRLTQVRNDLVRTLDEWMGTTDDPLLRGELVVPSGAALNTIADRSPRDPVYRSP
jgi:N-sulfoglucosamine sulfohydrolase